MADKDAEVAKNLLDVVDETVITPKTDLGDETTFILSKDGDTQGDPLTEKSKPLVPQSPSDKPIPLNAHSLRKRLLMLLALVKIFSSLNTLMNYSIG